MKRIAIVDDWGGMVRALPVWKRLDGRATIDAFQDTFSDEHALAERLAPYKIVVPTRERTFFRAGSSADCRRCACSRSVAAGPGRWTSPLPARRASW